MSAKAGGIFGSVGNEEKIVETELSKFEMTDTVDNEAPQEESFNVDESEANGQTNPRENQSLQGEEVDDQVKTTYTVLDWLFSRVANF